MSHGVQVRGLVFEANGSLAALAELVGGACQRLAAANVPHNLFIADCGARVFLLPNAFAERKVRINKDFTLPFTLPVRVAEALAGAARHVANPRCSEGAACRHLVHPSQVHASALLRSAAL